VLADVGEEFVAELNCPLEVTGAKRATDATLSVVEVQGVVHPIHAAVVEPEMVIASTGIDANRQVSDRHDEFLSLSCVFVRNVPGDASSRSIAGSRNHLVSEAEAYAARLDGRPLAGPANRAECWGNLTTLGRVVYRCSVS
jgi:hypothetical protein